MLLLVANPRSALNLIDFVNDMKKGGLFILGHVKTDQMDNTSNDICSQEYPYWVSLIDNMKIKAFVDMTSAPNIRDGVLQLMRLSGLGKMTNRESFSKAGGGCAKQMYPQDLFQSALKSDLFDISYGRI